MSTNKLYTVLFASALMFNAACDDDTTTTVEGGTPAGTEAGTPAGMEAGTPAGMEAGTPAGMEAGTPAGMEAGTPAGMEAGTPAGMEAGTPAGMEAGTEMLPERTGMGDTAPLACEGDYCPSARLSGLEIPADVSAANAGGCRLMGSQNGATLGGLLALAGDIDTNSFVNPDENGEIQLLLLNHLAGWLPGKTGNETGPVTANFYIGMTDAEGATMIDPASFDAEGNPYISFPETTITDGLLQTPASTFALSLPLVEGFNFELSLESAKLEGDVSVEGEGFAMSAGVLGGYLTKDSLTILLEGIYAVCDSDMPPSLCDTVGNFLSGNVETDLALLNSLVPFDTIINDSETTACSNDRVGECNAVSLCLFVEMAPAVVPGVGEAGK